MEREGCGGRREDVGRGRMWEGRDVEGGMWREGCGGRDVEGEDVGREGCGGRDVERGMWREGCGGRDVEGGGGG